MACWRIADRWVIGCAPDCSRLPQSSPHIGQVRGRGLLLGLELVTDKESLEPLPGASYALAGHARDNRLMIYPCPTPFGERTIEAVMVAPPLNVNERDVDEILNRLGDAVTAHDR